MGKKRKTWREKLEIKLEPKLVDDPRGQGKMLIPTPLDVDALIRRVEKGKLIKESLSLISKSGRGWQRIFTLT